MKIIEWLTLLGMLAFILLAVIFGTWFGTVTYLSVNPNQPTAIHEIKLVTVVVKEISTYPVIITATPEPTQTATQIKSSTNMKPVILTPTPTSTPLPTFTATPTTKPTSTLIMHSSGGIIIGYGDNVGCSGKG